ncbi:MAG: hypothetical protein FWC43_05675 [Planctomycetaceae bacterium]|nr:hypothetical protein [Planctomycetaceae bacterium]
MKKSIEELKDLVFSSKKNQEVYTTYRKVIESVVQERNVSPDLIDRIALAGVAEIPGLDLKTILAIKGTATAKQRLGELEYRWMWFADAARWCFGIAGYEWTPCRTPREYFLQQKSQAEPEMTPQGKEVPE